MKRILNKIIVLNIAFYSYCANAELPAFPTRNIDTRTIKKIGGKYQTATPHLPINKMSLDARIGLSLYRKNSYKFHVVKPEKVTDYFKSYRNKNVGGNMIDSPRYYNDLYKKISAKFKNKISDFKDYDPGYEAILCEKNDIRSFPYVCNTKVHDCYRLTLISPYLSKEHLSAKKTRFTSIDLVVMVKNPKTPNAYIEHLFPMAGTEKIGPALPFRFSAEHNIVGDQRLMVFRVGGKSTRGLNPEKIGSVRNNIVYSTYPKYKSGKKSMQCDVTKWNQFYPITHAHYDKKNAMKSRYKFARYALRDGLGRTFSSNEEFGGSYPWMDEDAANLFFTATGPDRFYNWIGGVIKGIYQEPPSNYVTPRNVSQSTLNITGLPRIDAFEKADRTVGVSYAGFWSHGKTVMLDGLLNNTDYNFQVSTPGIKDMTRKMRLYKDNPGGQYYEPTGMTRERGANAEYNLYAPNMMVNSSFMNSMTNRFNFFKKMKPGVPKDVTWHFSSNRYGEELSFDEFISPYVLINAEMNAVVGQTNNPYNFSMIHYDGFQNGRKKNGYKMWNFPSKPTAHSLLFQNAATAPSSFMKVPAYGRPLGDVRVEPIAKGGIHGKGLWLSGSNGIQFKVPTQTNAKNRFKVESNKDFYVGLFIDARWNGHVNKKTVRTIMQIDSYKSLKKIQLVKNSTSSKHSYIRFDTLRLVENDKVIAERPLYNAGNVRNEKSVHHGWKHFAIQFRKNAVPLIAIDGMYITGIYPKAGVSKWRVNQFFRISGNTYISLGAKHYQKNQGFRGWVDDFKVIARNITKTEEQCNLARGTLVEVKSKASGYWKWRASLYPQWVHNNVSRQAGLALNKKFACFSDYGNYNNTPFSSIEKYASLHRIPANTTSVRSRILDERKNLRYGKPRPAHTKNNFCMSCHVPNNQNPFKELNMKSLTWDGSKKMEHDPRRQPSQAPALFNGIVPANYFGKGKPSKRLINSHQHRVDQWIAR